MADKILFLNVLLSFGLLLVYDVFFHKLVINDNGPVDRYEAVFDWLKPIYIGFASGVIISGLSYYLSYITWYNGLVKLTSDMLPGMLLAFIYPSILLFVMFGCVLIVLLEKRPLGIYLGRVVLLLGVGFFTHSLL